MIKPDFLDDDYEDLTDDELWELSSLEIQAKCDAYRHAQLEYEFTASELCDIYFNDREFYEEYINAEYSDF